MKLTLTLLGRDSWSRPVYEGDDGRLYVDIDPIDTGMELSIYTKSGNSFDGGPDIPVHEEITFVPRRDTWW